MNSTDLNSNEADFNSLHFMNWEYDLKLTELDDPKITEDGLLAKYKQNPSMFVDPDPNVYND